MTLTCVAALCGQSTDKDVPLSKVERKNLAPVSKEPLRVKLPKPVEAKLENGLSVMVLEDHRLPTVSVQFVFLGAGGLFDPKDRPGLAAITAAMMREGTTTMNSRQIAEAVDELGASLSFNSGYGISEARMQASGLSENFEKWFGLFLDVLLNANFPDSELQKLKQQQLFGLRQQRGQAAFLANEMFQKAAFGEHPASVVTATPASVTAMTAEEIKTWRDKRYVPQNAILAIAGDVNAKQLIPKLSVLMNGWKKSDVAVVIPMSPKPPAERHVYLIDRPNSVQTNLLIGNLAIARNDADFTAFSVLNRILGGGAGSRLFMNLREEKSYTYGAYSNFQPSDFVGPWEATSEVRTPVTDAAMTEFLKEFERIRNEKVPASELQDAERSIVSQFALSLEQPAQLLNYAITRKRFGLVSDYWDTYPTRIASVTADDVQRVARKYISLENLQIVAVGDAAKIKSVMEKYGPVSSYASNGTPLAK